MINPAQDSGFFVKHVFLIMKKKTKRSQNDPQVNLFMHQQFRQLLISPTISLLVVTIRLIVVTIRLIVVTIRLIVGKLR